jgi:hypothetical protein
MDPIRNPYAPGAGTQPPELAGRTALLEQSRIVIERLKAGRSAKSFIAVGLRGVGKTVLLNRVRQVAEQAGYRVCMIEAQERRGLPDLLVPSLRGTLPTAARPWAWTSTPNPAPPTAATWTPTWALSSWRWEKPPRRAPSPSRS